MIKLALVLNQQKNETLDCWPSFKWSIFHAPLFQAWAFLLGGKGSETHGWRSDAEVWDDEQRLPHEITDFPYPIDVPFGWWSHATGLLVCGGKNMEDRQVSILEEKEVKNMEDKEVKNMKDKQVKSMEDKEVKNLGG